jgi:TolA-binding protein
MLRLAQCEYNAGRDTMALARFAATIERFPGTGAAREAQRGSELALYRLSQSPGGEKQLALLIDRYPSSAFAADAQFRLARRAYEQKRWIDAAEAFRRVVSQFPSYSAADHAQFLLSDAYAQAGRGSDAELGYEQFLSYFPQSELRTTVELRLGLIHFEAKDYGRAATAFMLALGDSASHDIASAARYDLALCERQLGQSDEARAELERYRTAWPNDARAADVALQLGDLDEAAGHLDDARREFESALNAKPGAKLAIQIQFRLGRAREQLGDTEGALRAYRVAAATDDRDDPFRLSSVARCAALYEARHEYAPALAAYRDLIRNARDRELVAAATDRASQLEAATRHR